MFLTRKTIGLDIGSSAVKAVEVGKKDQTKYIKKIGYFPLPMGVISKGIIQNEEYVSRAIAQAIRDSGISTKNVILSIDGQQANILFKTFPLMKKKELLKALWQEAQLILPISPNEIMMDYQVVKEYTKDGIGQVDVVIVVCSLEILESYINVVTKAGLEPFAIDIQPLSIARLLKEHEPTEDEELQDFTKGNTLLIDLGADGTRLSFFNTGNLNYYFVIPIGSNNLTKSIAGKCQVSLDEAAAIKKNNLLINKDVRLDILKPEIAGKFDLKAYQEAAMGLNSEDENTLQTEKLNLSQETSEFLGEIIKEIRSAIENYRSRFPSDIINQIILTGGGAKLPGLAELLTDTLDIKITLYNPLKVLKYQNLRSDKGDLVDNGLELAHGIGLALREVK